jgi:hypothetical protein
MTKRKTKYLFWFMALVTIMACVPGTAAPIAPTIDPNSIGTFIVQTANVAFTQTARAMPTLTHTPTITPTRATNTPEPTATNTVIFILSSPTAVVPATSTANATSNQAYSCQILSVTPANGTSFAGRTDFDATWKVRNNGQRNWNKDIVDYIYWSGDRIQKVDTYDLQTTIRRGESTDLIVDMVAPKNNGTYTTVWSMRAGTETFCTLSLTIVVK